MRINSALFYLITIFLISSCNNSNQILLQDESNISENKSVSLMLIESDHLFDHFPNHTFGALRPTEKNIFDSQLLQLFSEQTQSPVLEKKRSDKFAPSSFELREFQTEASKFTTISPKSGTDLNSSDSRSRFTLILDRYHFIPYQNTSGAGSYAGHEQEVQNRIKFKLIYVIWDNELQKEIGWGKVDSDHILYSEDIKTSYQSAISKAFQKIIDKSPFKPA
jgi:hypothetical protein